MAIVTQFCVALDNRPGTLAKLCRVLKHAKVNIGAISVSDNAECCWVRLVGLPAGKARTALTRGRYNFRTKRVLMLRVTHRVGVMERVATRLARAGVNINYVYGSNAEGPTSTLVLSVSDLNRAAKAVNG